MKPRFPPHPAGFQAGITLVEVLIYTVLAAALLAMAVSGLGRIHKGAFRSQELSRMQNDADEAIRLLARDSRNMGLKRVLFASPSGALVDTELARVDFGPADSSSFLHRDGDPYDTLIFIRPELDASGMPVAIDTIRYAVDPATRALTRTLNAGAPVEICRQVEALQFEYGLFAVKTGLASEDPPDIAHWTQNPLGRVAQTASGLKAVAPGPGRIAFWLSGNPINLDARHTYRVELACMADRAFLANVDSICLMLCNGAGTPVAMQSFLPDAALSGLSLSWSGVACAGCYAGFRMEMKGPGEFDLGRFRFTDVAQGNGAWTAHPSLDQKKAVRSYRVYLLTRSSQAMFGLHGEKAEIAGLALAFDDKLGRSLLEDVIAVPNNGN